MPLKNSELNTLSPDMEVIGDLHPIGAGGYDNIMWQLSDEGRLYISGYGQMEDFQADDAPWAESSDKITKISVIGGSVGIQRIPDSCFRNLPNLTSVKIQNVTEIGKDVFRNCNKIKELDLSGDIAHIGARAFQGCYLLKSVSIPERSGGKSGVCVDEDAFKSCSLLKELSLPNNMRWEDIDESAFSSCRNLKAVRLGELFQSPNQVPEYMFYNQPNIIQSPRIAIGFTDCCALKEFKSDSGVPQPAHMSPFSSDAPALYISPHIANILFYELNEQVKETSVPCTLFFRVEWGNGKPKSFPSDYSYMGIQFNGDSVMDVAKAIQSVQTGEKLDENVFGYIQSDRSLKVGDKFILEAMVGEKISTVNYMNSLPKRFQSHSHNDKVKENYKTEICV